MAVLKPSSVIESFCSSSESLPLLLLFLLLPLLPLLKTPRVVFSRGIAFLILTSLAPARHKVDALLKGYSLYLLVDPVSTYPHVPN
jgi:hypothetical protein